MKNSPEQQSAGCPVHTLSHWIQKDPTVTFSAAIHPVRIHLKKKNQNTHYIHSGNKSTKYNEM